MVGTANDTRKAGSNAKSDAAGVGLPRRRFFHDMPDRGLFAFVAVAGFTLVIWLKLHNHNPDVVAALAVALMFAYGAVAYHIPAVQLRLDRLGDNFYYLGFIYTLASMSAALMQLRGGIELEPILGSFGIALITTIVGVAGRVMFVQMRGEIDEVEEQVRQDLLTASTALKAQLSLALREFETFSTAVRQTASETASASEDAARKQVEAINHVAGTAITEIKTTFEASRSSARELSGAVEAVARTVEQTNMHLSKLDLPTSRFEQQLDSFGVRLQEVLEKLAASVEKASSTPRQRRRWYWPFRR